MQVSRCRAQGELEAMSWVQGVEGAQCKGFGMQGCEGIIVTLNKIVMFILVCPRILH